MTISHPTQFFHSLKADRRVVAIAHLIGDLFTFLEFFQGRMLHTSGNVTVQCTLALFYITRVNVMLDELVIFCPYI